MSAEALKISDEQMNELSNRVIGKFVKAMEIRDRKGEPNSGKNTLQDPNTKRWMDGLRSGFGPETDVNPDVELFKGLAHELKTCKQVSDFRAFGSRTSAKIDVKSFFRGRQKLNALEYVQKTAGVTDSGALQQVLSQELEQTVYQLPVRPVRMRDSVLVMPTSKDIKTFARQTGFTNASTTVPALNYDPATAVAYPQSALTITEVSLAAKTIATYIPVPKNLLDDIGETSQVLEHQLMNGVYDVEDAQILNGDGTGNNFLGLLHQPGIQTDAWNLGDHGDNQADAILNMIVKLWVAYYQPDTISMNPIDLKKIWKLKNTQDDYLFPVAHQALDYTDIKKVFYLWGLPVLQSVANTATQVLVGALKSAVVLWDREQANVWLSREHLDWAVKGLVAVIAEERAILQVNRPESLGLLDLSTGAPA